MLPLTSSERLHLLISCVDIASASVLHDVVAVTMVCTIV